MAFKTNEDVWCFLSRPENAHRQVRFSASMVGTQKLSPPNAILQRGRLSELLVYVLLKRIASRF
jgi:hypothetical protein